MSERLCVAYPLIARFLTAKDLGSLILTNKAWNTILGNSLYELYFDGAAHADETALKSFIDFFRRATMIHLSNANNLHSIDFPRFSVITMSRSSFLLTQNERRMPVDNLKHLSCGQCSETTIPMQHKSLICFVIQFPSLLSLRLIEAYYLCDKDLDAILLSCTSLTSLDISSAFHLVAPACSLGQNLTSLSLTKCPQCSFLPETSLKESSRRYMPHRLRSLDLSFTALTSASLSTIIECASQQLRSLTLVQCMGLAGNVTIASSTLTELSLRQCAAIASLDINCDLLQIINLSLCSRLRSLRLTSCSIPSLSLQMLQSLQQIDLKCINLKILDLSGCALLFRDSSNASLVSSQCDDVWAQHGISPYLAQQITAMQQNSPELDISKLIAHHAGGTILFEQRMELLEILAQMKLPRSNRRYERKISAAAIGVRSATNRTKSL